MITVENLRSIAIFEDFPVESLNLIAPSIKEKSFQAGTRVLYRGDPGNSMFMILRGSVAVTLLNDDGIEYSIATLGKGEIFGEIALLTGEPRSANVNAIADVQLGEINQETFLDLITAFPKLNESLLHLLAQRRARSMLREQFDVLRREEIIAHIFAQQAPDIDHFIGKSRWTAAINDSIKRLASAECNVLILGERGTGKNLAARLIHMHSAAGALPLYHLDCADPPPVRREAEAGPEKHKDMLHLEIAQESALFGHGIDAGGYAGGFRRGYLELADKGSIILENIDTLAPRVQKILVTYCRDGTFLPRGASRRISSTVRLIATTSRTPEKLRESSGLDSELLEIVNSESLRLKALRERKKDIPVIAKHYLDRYNEKFAKHACSFSDDAINVLVDYDWPLNVDELRQVVERAGAISKGEAITERQVFLAPQSSTAGKFNLLRIPFFNILLNHPLAPGSLSLVTVPFLLLLMACTLLGPQKDNPANAVIWFLWEPFLIVSVFFAGRSWCAYCPITAIADFASGFRNKFLPIPRFITKYGAWIAVGGLIAIIQSEHIFQMFKKALPSGILLLVILSGAIISTMLFGRRSWCKHLCPLGRMIAQYAMVSIIEIGSNNNVCSSQCFTHDCVRDGNCQMSIHPANSRGRRDCVLCLSCLRSCRHRSARVNARFPWRNLLEEANLEPSDAAFALLVIASLLAVKLTDWKAFQSVIFHGPAWSYGLVSGFEKNLLITISFIALVLLLSGFPIKKGWKRNLRAVGYAYVFLALSELLNVYLYEFVHNFHNLLPWGLGFLGFDAVELPDWLMPNLGTLKALLPMITAAGAISSLLMLEKQANRYEFTHFFYRSNQMILILTTLLFLFI